jgi:RNA polymerase sigma-70 factor (ECF subfamily)
MTDAVRRTDPDEWQIIDDHYAALRRFAAVAAPFDLDPDDLLQEALVRMLKRKALSEIARPLPYLRATMLNLAASHNRSMGAQRRALMRLAAADRAPPNEYPSDLAELDALPPKERAALYLAEVEGYRFDEIARMTGCSVAAARKRASRGRRRLRRALALEDGR